MERVGHVYRVKPGRAQEYARRHARIPAALEAFLREAGVRQYTMYLWGDVVFTHMEVDSFEKLVSAYNSNSTAASWEAEMAELIEYPERDLVTGWPVQIREIWNL